MPPIPLPKPEFSPYGRYLLNVDERKVEGPTYVHDTQNFKPECKIEDMPSGSVSRFNNLQWSIKRGFKKCPHCLVS